MGAAKVALFDPDRAVRGPEDLRPTPAMVTRRELDWLMDRALERDDDREAAGAKRARKPRPRDACRCPRCLAEAVAVLLAEPTPVRLAMARHLVEDLATALEAGTA